MVSVRRPTKSKQQSIWTVRNAILLFIVFQTINLMSKIARGPQEEPNLITTLEENRNKKPDSRPPPPDIKIEKVPEDHPHEDNDIKPDDQDHVEVKDEENENPALINHEDEPTDDEEKVEKKPAVEQPHHEEEKKPEPDDVLDTKNNVVLAKHGTGPTKLGYVVDLAEARQNADFRKVSITGANSNAKVAKLIGDESATLHSCDYVEDRRWMQRKACRDKDTPLIAYNTATFARSLCGHTIPPGQAIRLEEHCEEPVHIFPNEQDAPVDGKGMPPIVVQSKTGEPVTDVDDVKCNVPCKFEKGMTGTERYIADTKWTLQQTDEDPYAVATARMERTAFRHDHYYSTTSFRSSVPLSSYSFEKYDLRKAPKLEFEKLGNKATYLLNDKCSSSPIRRHKWFAAVAAAMDTESYGACHHNTDLGPDETVDTSEGRLKLYQKNRLALAFEAGSEKDHITDIVWEALVSGSVPVVLGASNLGHHLPKNAAIYTGNFNNWDKLSEFAKKVAEDKSIWESYQTWKTDEAAIKAFEDRYSFTKTPADCRVCRWAYAKKYGLGWDHMKQIIKENHVKRQLCLDKSADLSVKPFREVWVGSSKAADETSGETYPTYGSKHSTEIHVKDGVFQRTITHHDGVTDMELANVKDVDEEIILRIEIPVRNTEGAFFRNTHTFVEGPSNAIISSASIQDNFSKVTVLANWETTVTSPKEGVVEVHVQPVKSAEDELRRIRVITEDMNELHDKLTEFFPSSFGKMMIEDFIKPIEIYYSGVDAIAAK